MKSIEDHLAGRPGYRNIEITGGAGQRLILSPGLERKRVFHFEGKERERERQRERERERKRERERESAKTAYVGIEGIGTL